MNIRRIDYHRMQNAIEAGDHSYLDYLLTKYNCNLTSLQREELLLSAISTDVTSVHFLLKYIKPLSFNDLLWFAYAISDCDTKKSIQIGEYIVTLGRYNKKDFMLPHLLSMAYEMDKKEWLFLFLRYGVPCSEELLEKIKTKWGNDDDLLFYKQQKEDNFEENENIYILNVASILDTKIIY